MNNSLNNFYAKHFEEVKDLKKKKKISRFQYKMNPKFTSSHGQIK